MGPQCWFCRAEMGWNAFCPVCQEFRKLPAREQAERALFLGAMPENTSLPGASENASARDSLWRRLIGVS